MSEPRHSSVPAVAMLKNLRLIKHLELLDVVDDLRAQGLNEHVDLPQLIVCGDQSSGKSSVLAAVSGVPFPKKDNLCTRFATEVVLRRNDELQEILISVTITASSTRPRTERHALESFARELSSLEDLPNTMAEAGIAMGLSATSSAFSSDILRLEVRGPEMPQLTIVDLPGLIHSENKYQSADDIALVNALVEDYMSQERSIILAVISAKNDYANQIVLTKARKVDPQGRRTLGIITKPDTLHPGSTSESSFLGLAQNQDVNLSLGWHVVRNQDSNEPTDSSRDFIEAQFFETSRWKSLHKNIRGVHSLRERLCEVLFQQIKRELPGLISEILVANDDAKVRLDRMGRSRATLMEKRIFIMELGQRFREICFAACEGLYENPFFGELAVETAPRRLRAVVQNASIDFANKLLHLPLRVITKSTSEVEATSIALRAKTLIQTYRGKELPGTFNPLLIGQLFRELSSHWAHYTRKHTNNMWLCARAAVVAMLETLTEKHVMDVCMKEVVDPELDKMQKALDKRLDDYMLEFHRHPITYNHYLTDTVQALKEKRFRAEVASRCHQLFINRGQLTSRDIELIVDTVVQTKERNMDDLAAQDLVDYTEAYYKVNSPKMVPDLRN